jgi:hypothetical protein
VKNKNLTIIFLSVLIVALTIFNIFSWQKNNENENTILNLKNEMEKLNDDYLTLDANLVSLNDLNVILANELEVFRNPDNKIYFLNGIHPLAKEAKAILIWNKKDKTILFSSEGLPKVSDKTHYQLWALRNGKNFPIIALPRILSGNFIKLDITTEWADGFIITLEESGALNELNPSETYLSGSL